MREKPSRRGEDRLAFEETYPLFLEEPSQESDEVHMTQLVEARGAGHETRVVVGHQTLDGESLEDGGLRPTNLHLREMDGMVRIESDRHIDRMLVTPSPLALHEGRVGLVDRSFDVWRGRRGVENPLHPDRDLLEEVPDGAARDA